MSSNKYEDFFNGLDLEYSEKVKEDYLRIFMRTQTCPSPNFIKREMKHLGLTWVRQTLGHDLDFPTIIIAFQRKYRPESVTGLVDQETCAILYALVDSALREQRKRA